MFDMQLQGDVRGCGQEAVLPTCSLSGKETSRHLSQLEAEVTNLACLSGDAGNAESKMVSTTQPDRKRMNKMVAGTEEAFNSLARRRHVLRQMENVKSRIERLRKRHQSSVSLGTRLEDARADLRRARSGKHQANQLVVRPQHLVIDATREEDLTDLVRALEVEVASGMVENGALNDPLTGGLQKQF